jgi:hypothetical protein
LTIPARRPGKRRCRRAKAKGFGQSGPLGIAQEFGDGRLPAVLLDLDPGQALGAVDFDEFGVVVDLLARKFAAAAHGQRLDQGGRGEELELGAAHDFGHVGERQAEADVGLVHAVEGHGLLVLHARDGQGELLSERFAQHAGHHALGHFHDLLFVHERHLDIDLRELGLAVGAQVLVAEAFDDLKIAVHPAAHEELLEELGRLGQGVELALIDAAGNQKSRAPSGVDLVSTGVSISRNPISSR